MKRTLVYFVAMSVALAVGGVARAELFVVRIGAGAAPLTSASTATFIDRFNNDGTPSISPSIALPTAVSGLHQPLTNSGTAASEGALALSPDGQYLTLGGYGAAPGVASIASSANPGTARVVGRIKVSDATVDTTTAITDAFTANNIRSAVTSNGTDIWAAGANGGVRYLTLGGSTTTAINSAAPTNLRVVNIFNNQLYVSAASGTFQGVGTVGTGLPTTSGQTPTLLTGFPTASGPSAYDYWFGDANTVYVADDRTNGLGGIQKWIQETGTWTLKYTLATAANQGTRGLAGSLDLSGNATLFATTALTNNNPNQLVSIVDPLAATTAPGNTFASLATAATNTVFRGLEHVSNVVVPPTNNSDFDNDLDVDGDDVLIWQRGLGQTGLAPNDKSTGDADGDGSVTGADLDIWEAHYGLPPAVGAATGVPEPASLALVLCGLGALAARRRR